MFTAKEKAVLVKATKIIESKFMTEPVMSDAQTVKTYLMAQLAPEKNEVFAVMFLNSQHVLISFEKLFYGTVDSASVHCRPIIQRALELNAKALIVSHQHPSGIPEPSQADQMITKRICSAAEIFDISVLDHIVVGHGQCVSFAQRGLI